MPDLYTAEPETPSATPPSARPKPKFRDFIPPRTGNSLSALIVQPSKKVAFETQEEQEEILIILRQHWLTNVPWLFLALVLFFAPAVLRYFPLILSLPARFQLLFVVVWYLVLLMYVFERFLSWFYNLAIITDERIIDVDFLHLTSRRIADADIDKIQDVTYTNTGVFGTVFNFGDVLIQTAAERPEFVFGNVPRPAKIAEILQKMRTEEKQEALEGRIR